MISNSLMKSCNQSLDVAIVQGKEKNLSHDVI